MSSPELLPDEVWRRIMEIGIETKTLDRKAICSLSATCSHLRRLADDDAIWSLLLHLLSDFPYFGNDLKISVTNRSSSSSNASGKVKSLYKIRYEEEREIDEYVGKARLPRYHEVKRMKSRIAESWNARIGGTR